MRTTPKVIILGGGPAGLGAATRLQQLGCDTWTLFEKRPTVGGLASTVRDPQGFLWDMGVHVIFSHYAYFDDLMDDCVENWEVHERACGVRAANTWVPYPFQKNLHRLPAAERNRCLTDLIRRPQPQHPPTDFDAWMSRHFGHGIVDIFMGPYNRKIWTVDPKQMGCGWLGERVPSVDIGTLVSNTISGQDDVGWGPNATFRFPANGGTGSIWQAVADRIDPERLMLNEEVLSVDLDRKCVETKSGVYPYDVLINTMPLNRLIQICRTDDAQQLMEMTRQVARLKHTSTHIVGLGFEGRPPAHMEEYYWMYFAGDDCPFYRATQFSKYAVSNVPRPGEQWSLMFEIAESPSRPGPKDPIVATIEGARRVGLIDEGTPIVSTWHRKLAYGYPIPCLERDDVLEHVQPWLESHQVLSRGRFGGWKYEVANQDHSLMQGVEAADRALFQVEETTYAHPELVNRRKTTTRRYRTEAVHAKETRNEPVKDTQKEAPKETISARSKSRTLEVVVARYNEDIHWTNAFSQCRTVYNKGSTLQDIPSTPLANVGREAHTYLRHIVQNWDDLAEFTVFTQGQIQDHKMANLNQLLQAHTGFLGAGIGVITNAQRHHEFTPTGHIRYTGAWVQQKLDGTIRPAKQSFNEWFDIYIAPEMGLNARQIARFHIVSWGAIFSVHRDCIRSHPKAFYDRLLAQVEDHPHPEEAHYLERAWVYLFQPYTDSPYTVNAAGVVGGKMWLTPHRVYVDKRILGQLGVHLTEEVPALSFEKTRSLEGGPHQLPPLIDHGYAVSMALSDALPANSERELEQV